MDNQEIIMQIILDGGNARSYSMEAIHYAKEGNIKAAREAIGKAIEALGSAHRIQTNLIQEEAAGNRMEMSLLMVHAQDHMMNAITIKDLAQEFIDMYEKMYEK